MKLDARTLKIVRRTSGITQSELALKTHLAAPYISQLENGYRPINDELSRRLKDAIGIDSTTMQIIVAVHDSVAPREDNKCPVNAGSK